MIVNPLQPRMIYFILFHSPLSREPWRRSMASSILKSRPATSLVRSWSDLLIYSQRPKKIYTNVDRNTFPAWYWILCTLKNRIFNVSIFLEGAIHILRRKKNGDLGSVAQPLPGLPASTSSPRCWPSVLFHVLSIAFTDSTHYKHVSYDIILIHTLYSAM